MKNSPAAVLHALLLILAGALLQPGLASAELVNRVVAVVNNEVITLHDLQQEGQLVFKQIREQAPPMQSAAALRAARHELLGHLIDRKIIEQRAEKLDIAVTDEEVDAALSKMLAERGISQEDFQRELTHMGATEESYRATIRSQILQSKLIDYEVRSRVVITDEKVRQYYEEHYTAPAGDLFHILQMGFSWQDESERAAARQRAEEARQRVKAGEPFESVARAASDLPSAEDGGDIGIFRKNELAPYMREAIEAADTDGLSPIVETPSGFQFFKMLSDREGDIVYLTPFEKVKGEIREKLYKQEMETQFEKWVTQLREEADIKKLL